jgi:subtilisin family serine protease
MRSAVLLAWLVAVPAIAQETIPAHYLVFKLTADGVLVPQLARRVELSAPLLGKTDVQLKALRQEARREEKLLEFRVIDDRGAAVFQDAVWLSSWIRGEFHHAPQGGSAWDIESHLFPDREPVFVVRVPAIAGAKLVFPTLAKQSFDLDRLADQIPAPKKLTFSDAQAISVGPRGNPRNRMDLLILGDGYTAEEEGTFTNDAKKLVNDFFSLTPYAEYRNLFNVTLLYTPSNESGADHPAYSGSCPGNDNPDCCDDPLMLQDPLRGKKVSTAFNSRFCAFHVHRLLTVDNVPAFAAAANVPDWDVILMLVNDPTYGGSGGRISVSSLHSLSVDIARHEFGHTFSGLADEYDDAASGFPSCSDISGPPCEPNVTDQRNRAQVKWLPWIQASVPVPTPEGNPSYRNLEGLFEGARYKATGMYRHRDTQCLMNVLGVPFGAVCRQTFILRLYQGGWGVPASGIDLIEPGSEKPAPGNVTVPLSANLSISVVSPNGGAPAIQWLVDGRPVDGASSPTFRFRPAQPGRYQVQVKVRDATPLVNEAMGGSIVESTRQWSVTVHGGHCAPPNAAVPGEILVGLKPGAAKSSPSLGRLSAEIGAVSVSPVFTGVLKVVLPPDADLEAAIRRYAADLSVEYAEPNYLYTAAKIPSDPSFGQQWGLNNTGQSGGKKDADIDAPEGWDRERGKPAVVIAVLDTGVDARHPDLAGGKVLTALGRDFVNGDADATDDNGHGTAVAGIAAAGSDNALGMAGVCWGCRILPVKVLDATGKGSADRIAQGIQYAADRNARILNLSFGYKSACGCSLTLARAINYAYEKGSLLIAAAGNDADKQQTSYPAASPRVLAVGALDRQGKEVNTSNRDGDLDVLAPGKDILSLDLSTRSPLYRNVSGTSAAAAFTSGVAGLVWSARPQLKKDQVWQLLRSTTDRVPNSSVGLVNARGALAGTPHSFTAARDTCDGEPPL